MTELAVFSGVLVPVLQFAPMRGCLVLICLTICPIVQRLASSSPLVTTERLAEVGNGIQLLVSCLRECPGSRFAPPLTAAGSRRASPELPTNPVRHIGVPTCVSPRIVSVLALRIVPGCEWHSRVQSCGRIFRHARECAWFGAGTSAAAVSMAKVGRLLRDWYHMYTTCADSETRLVRRVFFMTVAQNPIVKLASAGPLPSLNDLIRECLHEPLKFRGNSTIRVVVLLFVFL